MSNIPFQGVRLQDPKDDDSRRQTFYVLILLILTQNYYDLERLGQTTQSANIRFGGKKQVEIQLSCLKCPLISYPGYHDHTVLVNTRNNVGIGSFCFG